MIVKLKHSEYGDITTIDNVSVYEQLVVDDPKGAVSMHWITKQNDAGEIISRCGWDCENWELLSVTNDLTEDPAEVHSLPEDFYHRSHVLFLINSDRETIDDAKDFLDDLCIPFACGIHNTALGPHAHFIINWRNLTRNNRVNLRSMLEDSYQAFGFSKSFVHADLSYLETGCEDQSDFTNHLDQKEN